MSYQEPCRPNDSADSIELRAAAHRFRQKPHRHQLFDDNRAAGYDDTNDAFGSRHDVELLAEKREGRAAGSAREDDGVVSMYPSEIRRSPLKKDANAPPLMMTTVPLSGVAFEKKRTRLCKAAKMGRLDVVERLVAQHPQLVDSREPCTARTPLHCAVRKHRWRVAAFLLAQGADANAADRDGMAPLHLAAVCAAVSPDDAGASSTSRLDDSCSSSAFDHHLDDSADGGSFSRTNVVLLRPHHVEESCEDCDPASPHCERPQQTRKVVSSPEALLKQHSQSLIICPSIPGQPEVHPHSSEFESLIKSGNRGSSSHQVPPQGYSYQCRPPADAADDASPLRTLSTAVDPVTPDRQQQRAPGRLRMRRYQPASPGPEEAAIKAAPGASAASPGATSPPHTPNKHMNNQDHQTPPMPLIDILVSHGAAVDARDRHGRTPLHWAAWKDMGASTAALMLHGADPDLHDNDGRLPVHLASIAGSLMALRVLLQFKVDWLGRDQAGRTALHLAAYWGQPVVVREVLNSSRSTINDGESSSGSSSPECLDDDGCTPLHLASWKGHIETIEELLRRGADPDAANNLGCTPLHLAAADGQQRAAEVLLDAGADPGSRDNLDQSPLHAAARGGFTALSRELIRRGAAINVQDEAGCTPLHLAATGSHSQALTELLHGGADPEAKDTDGNTALHCAAESGCHEVVAAVLSATGGASGAASRPSVRASSLSAGRGARRQKPKSVSPPSAPGILTAVNKKGWTALHVAASHGHAAAARLLIARGVAAKVPDAAGRLPIHIASAAGHAKIVELLIRRKPATLAAKDRSGATPLLLALSNRRSAAVEALLDSGADPNVVNELSGRTALSLAAERGSPELLSLLRHGADVEAPCQDGRTALHWAVDAQQVQTAEELLVAGATVRCIDSYGRTPLHWAAGRGGLEMLKILMAAGTAADLNAQDSAGRCPLHYAARMDQGAAMEELVKSGAKRGVKDADGKSPMHYAKGDWKQPSQKKILNGGSGTAASAMRRLLRVCTAVVDQRQACPAGAAAADAAAAASAPPNPKASPGC